MSKEKLSREEIAKQEIGHTSIKHSYAVVLCAMFLVLIFMYPLIQFVYEFKTRNIHSVSELQPLTIFPRLGNASTKGGLLKFNHELCDAIKSYEDTLEDTSALRALLLPPAQKLLLQSFRTGNEKVIIGQDGWLFYMSDFNYLANPGFLRPERLKKRELSGVQPDPVKAILQFAGQLKERGIRLILLPVPVKPMLYGEKLSGVSGILQNPSFREFKERLEKEGVEVVDLAPKFAAVRKKGSEPYLRTDTHWTPDGMELAARLVAAKIARPGIWKNAGDKQVTQQITALGDIAAMLKLENTERFFRSETVTVADPGFRPDKNASILLLGDSFTNIYDVPAMNWGANAGFANHLACHAGQPVDVIARNDAGAFATRELLAGELKRGRDRLKGKKVVVWEFAIRELADGNWKLLDMTLGKSPEAKFLSVEKPRTVTATVLALSTVPRPHAAPYKDHVMTLHLGDIDSGHDQALVYLESMRDNVLQPAASLRTGDTVQVELSPWSSAEAQYGSWNRSEINDENLTLQEPCWGKIVPAASRK